MFPLIAETAIPATAHSDAVLAGLIAISMGLVTVIVEITKKYFEKKEEKDETTAIVTAKLDDEAARLLREAATHGASVAGVVLVKDQNGTPMVYFPRQVGEDTKAIAMALRDVANSQARIVEVLDGVREGVDENNRALMLLTANRK